jgi:hypothetical protein
MAEETRSEKTEPTSSTPTLESPIPSVRTVADIPVIFADGVISHSYIAGVSKFYLYRTDTSPNVSEGAKNTVVAQIIMSAQGFAQMLHFFEHRLDIMLKDKAISQEAVDKIKETVFPETRKETIRATEAK